MADVRETLHMDAPAELVYDLVADLPRMGEWSTERGRYLAFDIFVGPLQVSRWEYVFAPDEDGQGCTVAEQWTDRRSAVQRTLGNRVVGERVEKNREGIRQTLRTLKRVAEAQFHPAS